MEIKKIAEHPSLYIVESHPKKASKTPILFIHGANMAAWCWNEKFMPYFSELGHPTYAVDLRGHGKSSGQEQLSSNSIADYVNDIERVIAEIGEPPILIGHSLGGLIVQKYIEFNTVPACILLASVPSDGLVPSIMDLFLNPNFFMQNNLSQLFGTLFSPVDVTRKSIFSGDVEDDVVIRYCTEMQPSSPKALMDTLWLGLPTKKNPFKIPMLSLGADEDTFFRPAQIRKTAEAYNADYINMKNTSHAMMLDSHWQESADAINTWLEKKSL
ncbi:MAG TPA: alpha/beta fold hydrolase [Cycloclasticus sp.]|jgi:pimeloyl-ACP methyl ester carboxylesterase|nr:alpha/beta fold hydrolase [Cycloclasticus sp.]